MYVPLLPSRMVEVPDYLTAFMTKLVVSYVQGVGLASSHPFQEGDGSVLPAIGVFTNRCPPSVLPYYVACASNGDPKRSAELLSWVGSDTNLVGEMFLPLLFFILTSTLLTILSDLYWIAFSRS